MHHALFTGWETQKIIQIISRPFLVSGSMSPASKSPAELIMEIKFLKWPSKNASHSTGEGLFHQQGWYLSLLTYIYQTELWTSKRHFSAALTQFPCPNTLLFFYWSLDIVLSLPVTGHVVQPCNTEWGNQMASGSNTFLYRDCFCDGLNSSSVSLLLPKA